MITREMLAQLQLPLLSLAEQRRIAAILDKADALCRKRKHASELLEKLSKSIFISFFGDLTSNQRHWAVVALDEVLSIDAPLVDPRRPEFNDLPHYGPDRIERDTGQLLAAKSAREDGLVSLKFHCDNRHVLYSKIRPYLNKVALSPSECLCSADVYPISPKIIFFGTYIPLVCPQVGCLRRICRHLFGKGEHPKINREQFLKFKTALPPLEMQQSFAAAIEKVQSSSAEMQSASAKADALFASLQYRAFSGQL